MKITLTPDEVETVLSSYGTNHLHIRTNTVDIMCDGSAVLSYEPPAEQERRPTTIVGLIARGVVAPFRLVGLA